MALPELLLPSTLPDFKSDSYALTPDALYGAVARQTGHRRQRRLFTAVPRMVDAQLEVSSTQLETFYNWHETALLAGAVSFTAKLAAMGTGFDYWEAHILSFSAEHQEGVNQHLVSLKLRLTGSPSSSAPVATSMTAEAQATLVYYLYTDPSALDAEAGAVLDLTVDLGPLLSAEAIAHLYTEGNGAESVANMDAEAWAGLEFEIGILPGELFDAEAAAALDLFMVDVIEMTAELSAALLITYTSGGGAYVGSPSNITLSDTLAGRPALAEVQFEVRADGTVYTQVAYGAITYFSNWFTPTTPGIGSGLWIKVTLDSGQVLTGVDTVGSVLSLASNRLWRQTAAYAEGKSSGLTVNIASDPDMITIVSSFTASLSVDNTPP